MSLNSKKTFVKVVIAAAFVGIVFGVWSVSLRGKSSIDVYQDRSVKSEYDQVIPLVLDVLAHHKVPLEAYRDNYTNWLAHKPVDSDDVSKYHVQLLHEIFSNEQFFQTILAQVLNEPALHADIPLRYEQKVYLLNLALTFHNPEAEILADIKAGYDPISTNVSGVLDRLNNKAWFFDFDHGFGNHNQDHSYFLILRDADGHFTTKLLLKESVNQSFFNPQTGVLTILGKEGTCISDYLESKYQLENDKLTPIYEGVSLRGDTEKSWAYEQNMKDHP